MIYQSCRAGRLMKLVENVVEYKPSDAVASGSDAERANGDDWFGHAP